MANKKQKGGYSKTLKKVSKELAGASKMHAGQSKKTATLARQLLKKQKGGVKTSTTAMSSDTIQGLSSDQNAAKIKFERNIKKGGLNPSSRSVKSNTTVSKDSDGNFIYRYITPTEKKHGGVHSDSKDFMKRMGYYQAGGLSQTPMYGANTMPGTPETAQLTYQEADQAKLDALDEQLKEQQESTAFMDEAKANTDAQAAKIAKTEQGLSMGIKGLDKLGAFNKLKQKGIDKAAKLAADKLKDKGTEFVTNTILPEAGSKAIDVAPKSFVSSLGKSDQAAKFGDMIQKGSPKQIILEKGSQEVLKEGVTSAATGLSPAAYGNIGAVASLAGEGIKMASDDQDATTMNFGETSGSTLSGIGTGMGAATTAAMLMGAPLGPVGMAAGAIGGALYGAGKGLIQRNKARREEDKAERKQEVALNKIKTQQKIEGLKDREYSGYDMGQNLAMYGGMKQYQAGGVASPGELKTREDTVNRINFLQNAQQDIVKQQLTSGIFGNLPIIASPSAHRDAQLRGVIDEKRNLQGKAPLKKKMGGVDLPGGTMEPIPGSDAVEFKGQSHDEGGIMLDPQTEVEGNETMDQVTMAKKGGKRDYFFSQHLKMGGKSFAQRHKDILQNGGSQKNIDQLAKLQEEKAGRDPNVVKLGAGGYKTYQLGGQPAYSNFSVPSFDDLGNLVQSDLNQDGIDDNSQGVTNYVERPKPELTREEKNHQDMLDKGFVFDETTGTYKKSKPTTSTTSNTNTKKEPVREPVSTFEPIPMKTMDQVPTDMYNNNSLPGILPYADGTYPNVSDEIKKDLTLEEQNLIDKSNSDRELTDAEERALRKIYKSVPNEALVAAGAQLIPAIYALSRKDAPAEQMSAPGRLKGPQLDRVSYNQERSQNAADSRSMGRFIEQSGVGPAGIIAKMSSYRRKQEGDMKIAAQESRANIAIANQEAQMQQNAEVRNVANRLQVDQVNTAAREAERVAQINRKQEAIDVLGQGIAGTAGDVMSYKANERLAMATGDMGIYERDRLRTFLKGQINPDTGKPYTNSDIATIFNKQFKDPVATKEDKKDKDE